MSLAFSDNRTAKAVQIAETAHTWRRLWNRDGEQVYGMPSQTTAGLYYLVTETSCTCPDQQHNGLRHGRIGQPGLHLLCKHIRAVHLDRMQHEPNDDGLVLERLPGGSYAWLRPDAS